MSKQSIESISCMECGKKFDIIHWESVNNSIDPNLKELIINGYIWKQLCPKCGTEIEIESALLYNDSEKKYMIQYEPLEFDQENISTRLEILNTQWNEVIEKLPKIDLGLNFRYVISKKQLIEKIKIADAGLNDVAIELLKLGYKEILKEEGILNCSMYFDKLKEVNVEMIVEYGGLKNKVEKRSFPFELVYRAMLNIVTSVGFEKRLIYIDENYCKSVIDRYKNLGMISKKKRYCTHCKKDVVPTFHELCPYCEEPI